MTQFGYIETPYEHVITGVADVQAIIDAMKAQLPAAGYTNPVGDEMKTPVDAAGRFMTLLPVRAAANRLQLSIRDDLGRVSTVREMQVASSPTVAIYFGAHYCYIENRVQAESVWASMMSLWPAAENAHPDYHAMHGTRTSAGTDDGNGGTSRCIVWNQNTLAYQQERRFLGHVPLFVGLARASRDRYTSGGRRWNARLVYGRDSGGYAIRGRLYNSLWIWRRLTRVGAIHPIPIDDATTGRFRVLNIPYIASEAGERLAMVRVP
ncbi:MAG TPA: hypothetical protein VFT32_13105 [Candidatus Eisenbacteria bacterium]|nr:hypothetical protein [Candidatus Eisenbacteria bacterium]